MYELLAVDEKAEEAVVELIGILFNHVAYFDPFEVRKNVCAACEGGMPVSDRMIDPLLIDYLLANMEFIYIGLIVCDDFREQFKNAVRVEIALDELDDDHVERIRKKMGYIGAGPFDSDFIIDLSTDNEKLHRVAVDQVDDMLDGTNEFENELNECAYNLSEEDMTDIGYIVGNFMYLFRAFSKNIVFREYVMNVTDSVKSDMNVY